MKNVNLLLINNVRHLAASFNFTHKFATQCLVALRGEGSLLL
jgi:hypothetical protein